MLSVAGHGVLPCRHDDVLADPFGASDLWDRYEVEWQGARPDATPRRLAAQARRLLCRPAPSKRPWYATTSPASILSHTLSGGAGKVGPDGQLVDEQAPN